ncbi:MAG TPA: tRNA lysidine(34) synthetase TilS [Acidimicrobiales bacterium]|nr:MAG: tRNA lysidine(34) synthetase TilS [Actinobacteria bacterium 21-73-9]HQU25864.1 tRNA lysidine(34) synthetase TilS [Acidimicrobiales bacterium]
MDPGRLLGACAFPPAGTVVDLAVSGGPDSVGLTLLALEAGLVATLHHVDHHARPDSGGDADFVRALGARLGAVVAVHDVSVPAGPNFEARARAARRAALPEGVLTGHTMDDLAETVLLNVLRGAGLDGLSPMVGDATKPLLGVRRGALAAYVAGRGIEARRDPTNVDPRFRRNRVRHEVLPLLDKVAERDVVPLLARLARLAERDRRLLEGVAEGDRGLALGEVDVVDLLAWPRARLARWLRSRLARTDELGEVHPPSEAEVDRAIAVVDGSVVATELSGGRRLSRRARHLALEDRSTTLADHG